MRKLVSLVALFIIGLLTLSMVSALDNTNIDMSKTSVKVNGDEVNNGQVLAVEEGQDLNIRVGLIATAGASDIEVDAKISGAEGESISDSTDLFDIAAGTTKYVNLKVTLPLKLDLDTYTLRLRVLNKNTPALELNLPLAIEPSRHGVDVADVSFSPGNTVKAGRSLLTTVLLRNYGDRDEDNVKVTVSIPSLGVSATEFADVAVDNHNIDYKAVPEMFLPIPANAAEGDYQVEVTAKYDDLQETSTKTFTVHVTADERFQTSTATTLVLAVGPETQNVEAGKAATYAIALTNQGQQSKAFVLEAVADWATVTMTDSLVVLEPGRNAVTYVTVTPSASATLGEHVASVKIKSGSEVLQTVTFRGNIVNAQPVVATSNGLSLRNGLEIALVVLVVLLVIIGLIIGFSRLQKDDEDSKTYY